jgi:hypothetical protein
VRVWLDPSGPVARGDPVRVYVQSAADGYLVVMHRGTDGSIRVLFPANPADDPFVRSGTYEIRSAGDRESFVVAEPDGQGLVLAAVSPSSLRFDEFLRAADWNPDALAPSWEGADAAGGLTDIVQRMLGDGYFNYDIATYTVAPRSYAEAPAPQESQTLPACEECALIGPQIIILEDPLFTFGLRRFHREALTRASTGETPIPAIALSLRLPGAGVATPLSARRATPRRRQPIQTFEPRRRVLDPRPPTPVAARPSAIPLRPGRRLAEGHPQGPSSAARGRALVRVWGPASASAAPASSKEVRLTMSPIPARGGGGGGGEAAAATDLNPARRVLVPASAELFGGGGGWARASATPPPGISVTSMSQPRVVPRTMFQGAGGGRVHPTADAAAIGEALPRTGAQANTVTLPRAVWGRGSLPPVGGRRH